MEIGYLPARNPRLPSVDRTEYDFGQMVMYTPENIERQGETESSGAGSNLKRHLVIEFLLIRVIEDNLRAITITL